MIEIVIPSVDYMNRDETIDSATRAFLLAIDDEFLANTNVIDSERDRQTVFGGIYNRTRNALRNHAKGCDCMDCARIEV